MYLTDEGDVKAQNKANGSITVIRDTVPTTSIPYKYEVEQTSNEGLFEVINSYVPSAGKWSSSVQTVGITAGRYEILYGQASNYAEGAVYIIDYNGKETFTINCQSWSVATVVSGNLNIYTYRIKVEPLDGGGGGILTISQTTSQIKSGGTITEVGTENQSFKYRKITN
jgi:hypothetical protein